LLPAPLRGIGQATVKKLSEQGFSVVGLYLASDADAMRLVAEYPAVTMLKGDVGREVDVVSALERVSGKYGRAGRRGE
jgi:NAD(P)-dependent dehydrogenase (short-subunit alcohol dehydrogenase family)